MVLLVLAWRSMPCKRRWDTRPTVSPLLTPIAPRNSLLLQSLLARISYRQGNGRRRKDDTRVGTAARGNVERLYRFPRRLQTDDGSSGRVVVPYQQVLETEADQHPVHLYLQGLLSHLDRKNAEAIAAFVDVGWCTCNERIIAAPDTGVIYLPSIIMGGRRDGTRRALP